MPTSPALACRMSWQVSSSSTSTPPSISAERLLGIGGSHVVKADVAERGQLSGGAHRTGDETLAALGREVVGYLARQLGGGQVDLVDVVLHLVLGHDDRVELNVLVSTTSQPT